MTVLKVYKTMTSPKPFEAGENPDGFDFYVYSCDNPDHREIPNFGVADVPVSGRYLADPPQCSCGTTMTLAHVGEFVEEITVDEGTMTLSDTDDEDYLPPPGGVYRYEVV